jgi:SSS family solute:Na+ symporter
MSIFMPVCDWITGQAVLFPDSTIAYIDPLVLSLPLSVIALVLTIIVNKNRLIETTDKGPSEDLE